MRFTAEPTQVCALKVTSAKYWVRQNKVRTRAAGLTREVSCAEEINIVRACTQGYHMKKENGRLKSKCLWKRNRPCGQCAPTAKGNATVEEDNTVDREVLCV
jgi:hypothetical protein